MVCRPRSAHSFVTCTRRSQHAPGRCRHACYSLLHLPPFDLTDRLETRQQTRVLLPVSNYCCPFHVVTLLLLASCIRLNSMARNFLVAVSNPIPSSLRHQNLSWCCSSGTGSSGGPSFAACHGIFISSSLAASHNSSFEQN